MSEAAKRPRTGGRRPGVRYAPDPPAAYGTGRFPYKDYSSVEPAHRRAALEWWQDIAVDVRERRFALGLEQTEVARRAGVALNTLQRIERGDWTHPYNLFVVCAVLGLRIEQADPVRRKR